MRFRPTLLLSLLNALILFVAVGCGGAKKFEVTTAPEVPVRVGVVDFQDQREYVRKISRAYQYPLVPFSGYTVTRFERVYESTPFPKLYAQEFAQFLREKKVFSEVEYTGSSELPEPGKYDIVLRGTIQRSTIKGSLTQYGLWELGQLLWYTGLPKYTRKWDLASQVEVLNGYTFEPLSEPLKAGKPTIAVANETGSKLYTRYYPESSTKRLRNTLDHLWGEFTGKFRQQYPAGTGADAQAWANLRNQGEELMRSQVAARTAREQGTKPVFTFLSPVNGANVRTAQTGLRWAITAPEGLKSAALVVNGQGVDLGINPLDLADETNPMTAVPAQETQVPLKMGQNTVEAQVIDYRNNRQRFTMTVNRLPQPVTPQERYALLIGMGSANAQAGARALQQTLASPFYGQFNSADVTLVEGGSFDAARVQEAVRAFGRKPLANQVAFVYVAVPGNAADLTLGTDGTLKLADLLAQLDSSLATDEVIVLLDIDWTGTGSGEVLSQLGSIPQRWAILTASNTFAATPPSGSSTALASAVDTVLQGREGASGGALTLEGFLEAVRQSIARQAPDANPAIRGRYNPSLIMAQRD